MKPFHPLADIFPLAEAEVSIGTETCRPPQAHHHTSPSRICRHDKWRRRNRQRRMTAHGGGTPTTSINPKLLRAQEHMLPQIEDVLRETYPDKEIPE